MASVTGTKGGTWQTRYFVLKPNVMLYYFESEHSEQPMGCIGACAWPQPRLLLPKLHPSATPPITATCQSRETIKILPSSAHPPTRPPARPPTPPPRRSRGALGGAQQHDRAGRVRGAAGHGRALAFC